MSYEARETSVHAGEPIECYLFTRGSTSWLLTSADRQVVLPAFGTFEPEAVLAGGQEHREEDDQGGTTIELPRTSPIVADYIPLHPPVKTWIKIYRAHRGDETSPSCVFNGWVDVVSFSRDASVARLQCVSLFSFLRRRAPSTAYTVQCNHVLYGVGCGLDSEDYRDECSITAVDGATLTSPGFALRPDGYFKAGWIERENSQRRFVVDHVGNEVVLMTAFADLAPPETVSAFAGCDLTRAVCISRFDNVSHFLGFEWIPYRDPHRQRIRAEET